jgi:hypothetical protein
MEPFEPTGAETRWARWGLWMGLLWLPALVFGNVTGDWRPMYLYGTAYAAFVLWAWWKVSRTRQQPMRTTVAQLWRTGEPGPSSWPVEIVVDALPRRLWKSGNLYSLPFGEWHFCVADHPEESRTVRTVEWRGRQVAMGRRPARVPASD